MAKSILDTKSFTISFEGLVNVIITDCKISQAFDPRTIPVKKYPSFRKYKGLWDTGATNTVITKKVVDELGLISTGYTETYNANGSCYVNTYFINIGLPNGVAFHTLQVTEGILNGFDALIGMDIISRGDFSITNKDNKTLFSFQIPSTHSIDFVEEFHEEHKKAHTPIIKDKTPGRNDPCICGSGNKYKNCCGK